MNLNEDYKFRDDMPETDDDTVPVEVLTGPYKGVVFRFTTVQLQEGEFQATLKFQYELFEMGQHTETSLRSDPLFNNTAGLILNQIILDVTDAEVREEANKLMKEEIDDDRSDE